MFYRESNNENEKIIRSILTFLLSPELQEKVHHLSHIHEVE